MTSVMSLKTFGHHDVISFSIFHHGSAMTAALTTKIFREYCSTIARGGSHCGGNEDAFVLDCQIRFY